MSIFFPERVDFHSQYGVWKKKKIDDALWSINDIFIGVMVLLGLAIKHAKKFAALNLEHLSTTPPAQQKLNAIRTLYLIIVQWTP